MPRIEDLFLAADDAGVRLEIIGGLPVWEALPNLTHQKTIDRIRAAFTASQSLDGGCECLHYSDLHIKFPDGSDKRPDIAIFCHEPTETENAVTQVPDAVIEIISKGYEKKDLELGPPFYLGQGVKDIVVFDPYTKVIDRRSYKRPAFRTRTIPRLVQGFLRPGRVGLRESAILTR